MATPTIRQAVGASGGSLNAVATLGAGTAIGDLLLVFTGIDDPVTLNNPTFSQVVNLLTVQGQATGGPSVRLHSAVVTVAGTQTVTLPVTATSDVSVSVIVINGTTVDASTSTSWLDGSVTTNGPLTPLVFSMDAPSVSPVTSDALLLCDVQTDGNGGTSAESFTPPTGMTEQTDTHDNALFEGASVASLILSSSGATGIKTFTALVAKGYATLSVAVKGPGAAASGPKSVAIPGKTWRRQFKHKQERQPDVSIVSTPPVSWIPSFEVRRRNVRRIPNFRTNSGTDVPESQLLPPSVRRPTSRTRRKPPIPSAGGDTFSPPSSASRLPLTRRQSGRLPRWRADGDSFEPPFIVTTPPVNPSITQLVTGRIRRAALVLRRPSSAPQPVPAQVIVSTAPAITATTLARVRRAAALYRRRAATGAPLAGQDRSPGTTRRPRAQALSRRLRAQAYPVPTQQAATPNPSITQTVYGRLRTVGRIKPRTKVNNPVPAQQAATPNPTITQTVYGRLRTVGRIRPRYRVSNPTPAQQAATPNPAITATVFGRLRTVGRIKPRTKINNPVPAQQAVTPNPAITVTVFGRLRTVGRIKPRAKVSTPVPPQAPVPVRVFGRLRIAGRTNRIPRAPKPIPPQVNPTYPIRPSVGGLSGLRRVWLKIRRKNAYPVPGQVTTLSGPLTITDSHGGVEADRNAITGIGGVYGSSTSSNVSKGSSGGFTPDPDSDNVAPTYDSDSDSL